MADPTLLELLAEGPQRWNADRPGSVDLVRVDLSGADLRGVDLRDAHLRESNLAGAKLSGATLNGAVLIDGNLSGADLSNAYLAQADLSDANLEEVSLVRAKMLAVRLGGANLAGSDVRQADLRQGDLRQANLHGSDMSEAILMGARLVGSNLSKANLNKANLRRANLTGARLCGADLCGADLSGARLSSADLTGIVYDDTTQWPDGFHPPPRSEQNGADSEDRFVRIERLDEHGADVMRWGVEPIIGMVSELLDDTSLLSRQIHLDPEQLATVEQYRTILMAALQGPDPEAVIIARAVARLAAIIGPTPSDTEDIAAALEEADVPQPTVAAAAIVNISQAVTIAGHGDAEDDRPAADATRNGFAELARSDSTDPSIKGSIADGLAAFFSGRDDGLGGMPELLKIWLHPKNATKIAAALVALGGTARAAGPLVQYAAAQLHAIFPGS